MLPARSPVNCRVENTCTLQQGQSFLSQLEFSGTNTTPMYWDIYRSMDATRKGRGWQRGLAVPLVLNLPHT
jgi:hypothetical protein